MKTQNRSLTRRGGFTLIELMVVMVIIAILAGVALPIFQQAQLGARMAAAMQQGRQIGLGLLSYSGDYDGRYPDQENVYGESITTSNDAFRSLVPDYLDNESVFAVSRSNWGSVADQKMDSPAEILKAGENHFSYVAGLDNTSGSLLPLIVDGTTGNGYYTRDEHEKGGCWKGTKAVVVRNDMSARLVPLRGSDNQRYIPDTADPSKNQLEVETSISPQVRLLDPS